MTQTPTLPDPRTTPVGELTAALCDLRSVSGDEGPLADAVEAVLSACAHLTVLRHGNTVVARTELGRADRVVLAGHLDTVPLTTPEPNLPTRLLDGAAGGDSAGAVLWGRGTVDMKGGVAVLLHVATRLAQPGWDVTYVFYDNEEVSGDLNGLGRVAAAHPQWIDDATLAVLGEPTNGGIEGGCNGSLRVAVTTRGTVAHSGRSWLGVNAIHGAAPVLARLAAYEARTAHVDGLTYREGLNAVGITGGVATNSVPDVCTVLVNFRFAPDRSGEDALAHVREVFDGIDADIEVEDLAPGARPGLTHPIADAFATVVREATGRAPEGKVGWTDVARFSAMGIPALNFGPGDPSLAHADDERCPVHQIEDCAALLTSWLEAGAQPS